MKTNRTSTQQPGEILLAIYSAALDREGMEAVVLRLATLSKGDRHSRIVETPIDEKRISGRYREMEEIRLACMENIVGSAILAREIQS